MSLTAKGIRIESSYGEVPRDRVEARAIDLMQMDSAKPETSAIQNAQISFSN